MYTNFRYRISYFFVNLITDCFFSLHHIIRFLSEKKKRKESSYSICYWGMNKCDFDKWHSIGMNRVKLTPKKVMWIHPQEYKIYWVNFLSNYINLLRDIFSLSPSICFLHHILCCLLPTQLSSSYYFVFFLVKWKVQDKMKMIINWRKGEKKSNFAG